MKACNGTIGVPAGHGLLVFCKSFYVEHEPRIEMNDLEFKPEPVQEIEVVRVKRSKPVIPPEIPFEPVQALGMAQVPSLIIPKSIPETVIQVDDQTQKLVEKMKSRMELQETVFDEMLTEIRSLNNRLDDINQANTNRDDQQKEEKRIEAKSKKDDLDEERVLMEMLDLEDEKIMQFAEEIFS